MHFLVFLLKNKKNGSSLFVLHARLDFLNRTVRIHHYRKHHHRDHCLNAEFDVENFATILIANRAMILLLSEGVLNRLPLYVDSLLHICQRASGKSGCRKY